MWVSNTGSELLVACTVEVKATPPAAYVEKILLINHGHVTWLPWLDDTAEGATAFPATTGSGMPANSGT